MHHEQSLLTGTQNRRQFFGTVAAVAGTAGIAGCAGRRQALLSNQTGGRPLSKPASSTVYLRTGKNRFDNVAGALNPLQSQVAEAIQNKQVIVKVNCGLVTNQYTNHSTHSDHLRAILEFLKPIYDRQILISEGTASLQSSILPAYENYGYKPFESQYYIKFIDANEQPTRTVYIHAAKYHPIPIEVNFPYMDPNVYLISAARIKTHNAVVGTFSMKNVVMGSPQCRFWTKTNVSDKPKMHGLEGLPDDSGGRELSYNLFTVALAGVRPNLAVVDGAQTIQGDGPWGGEVVDHGIALASTDFVAADRLCTELTGIDPFYMKYLEWCGDAGMGNWDMGSIRVDGPNYRDHIIKYKLNKNVAGQIGWIDRDFVRK